MKNKYVLTDYLNCHTIHHSKDMNSPLVALFLATAVGPIPSCITLFNVIMELMFDSMCS